MTKAILYILVLLAFFALGIFVTRYYYQRQEVKKEVSYDVVLERVKKVAKLITVEGYFTEVYSYKDYWGYDLPFLRKRALVRVRAKVSVGYDLNQLKIEALPESKTILVSHMPEPEILSIDHDLDYYDVSEGTFNSFSEQDYNKINTGAKQLIEEKAKQSNLLETASQEGNQALDLMKFIAESAGWKFEIAGVQMPRSNALDSILN